MPIYDMYCKKCNKDAGIELFSGFSEYDNIANRCSCKDCGELTERKPVQTPLKKGDLSFRCNFHILGKGQ